MTDKVNTQSAAAGAMARPWPMIAALMGGTATMRDQGAGLLPRWPNEELPAWQARLDTATLFPALRRTVSVMAGKPFSKPVTLSEDTPDKIKTWADDIDLEGTNLHAFMAEQFAEGITYGLAGILVDAPKSPKPGKVLTLADERAGNMRPYFVRVRHDQILGWRAVSRGGRSVLTQLRIAENGTEPDGDYGEKTVERVRVLTPGAFEVWQRGKADASGEEWTKIDEGQTGVDFIPFAPLYGVRRGFMCGHPPLIDLAYMNVKHWQSQSDQDTILHVARVPILFMSGNDDKAAITMGAGTFVKGPVGSDLKWVEHSGAAIKAGHDSLAALEDQMIQAGAELLVKKPGERSATEAAGDMEANKSDLQRIGETFADSVNLALFYMAKFAGLGENGGKVQMFSDYGAVTLDQATGQLIVTMQMAGLISTATAIAEMKRRGLLSDNVDADDERDLVEAQGPALGTIA